MARPKKKPVCQPIPPAVFEAEARAAGHKLWRFTYYDADRLCSVVLADEDARTVCVENYVTDLVVTAFGVNLTPTWDDLLEFLEDRCMPRTRAGLCKYLDSIGVDEYDVFAIVQKTGGRMAEDYQWMEVEVS